MDVCKHSEFHKLSPQYAANDKMAADSPGTVLKKCDGFAGLNFFFTVHVYKCFNKTLTTFIDENVFLTKSKKLCLHNKTSWLPRKQVQ